jgi:hypothetical protein
MDIVSALTGTTAQVVSFLFCVVAAIAVIRRSAIAGRAARIEKERKWKARESLGLPRSSSQNRPAEKSG